MNNKIKAKDIMTKNVITVNPETSIVEAANIIAKNHFDGLPVVDKNNVLQGIINEYDLISKDSAMHLPTFQRIMQNIQVYKKDKSQFNKEIESLINLKVENVMNKDPLILPEDADFNEVLTAFREHHRVNPIPIIDKQQKVVGIISRFDVLKPIHKIPDWTK